MVARVRPGPFLDSIAQESRATWTSPDDVLYINMEELVVTKIQGPGNEDWGKTLAHNSQQKREEKGARYPKTQTKIQGPTKADKEKTPAHDSQPKREIEIPRLRETF